jgi:hypothetical protein
VRGSEGRNTASIGTAPAVLRPIGLRLGACVTVFVSFSGDSFGAHRFMGRADAGLKQHADEHRRQRPVLLAVDQLFGEGAAPEVVRTPCTDRFSIP